MTEFDYDGIASRLTGKSVVDLDAVLKSDKKPKPSGGELSAPIGGGSGSMSSVCWPLINADQANIGIRISDPVENLVELAGAMIAIAAERNITPIIMSQLNLPDFSQYGFRVERIAGRTAQERANCEDEIRRFYDIAMVVEAKNLVSMN